MSSTNRGKRRSRDDQYFTRYPVALAICERLVADGVVGAATENGESRRLMALEPSCGKGAFVTAMKDAWGDRIEGLHALDINDRLLLPEHRDNATRIIVADFLTFSERQYDLQLGNPPYADAELHVRHGISILSDAPGAALVFLMRLNFLAGIERQAGLFRTNPPEFVYVLDKRPPFLENNSTDSCEYGVFVWRKKKPEYETALRYLRWKRHLRRWACTVEKRMLATAEADESEYAVR